MDPRHDHWLCLMLAAVSAARPPALGWRRWPGLLARDGAVSARPAKPGSAVRVCPILCPGPSTSFICFKTCVPPHVDLFDYKPQVIAEMHGKPVPEFLLRRSPFQHDDRQPARQVDAGADRALRPDGRCGAWVSNLIPHTAQIADDFCFIKSMHTEAVNHAPAISFLLTGGKIPGRPTFGAWLVWTGHEAEQLPAFLVMTSISNGTSCGQIFYDFYWGSGLPALAISGGQVPRQRRPGALPEPLRGQPRRCAVACSTTSPGSTSSSCTNRRSGDRHAHRAVRDGLRCRRSVPELADFSNEPPRTLEMYGPEVKEPGTFAHNCLMARRLVSAASASCS